MLNLSTCKFVPEVLKGILKDTKSQQNQFCILN